MTQQNTNFECIARLSIRRLERGLYEYQVRYGGQLLAEGGGQSEISQAIVEAVDTSPQVSGFEIEYDAYLVGTFTHAELSSGAEAVALAAVSTKAKFRGP